MDETEIGKKIKEFRNRRRLTLDKLADYTGFSKSYLSRIENSKKIPSISTLARISWALSVNFADLFPTQTAASKEVLLAISRSEEVAQQNGQRRRDAGHIYKPLGVERTGKKMKPYIVIPAFSKKVNLHHEHEGEEFLYVLEGKLEFFFDGQSRIFEQDDSLYFDASVPHFGRSIGEKKAKLLIVTNEPTEPI
jgi:transcriptional regulator with XRE-family HTH domain